MPLYTQEEPQQIINILNRGEIICSGRGGRYRLKFFGRGNVKKVSEKKTKMKGEER